MDTATILTHHRRKLIQSGSTDNSVITGQWCCLCQNMQTQWCYQWTELASPVVYNRRHIQIDLWLTFSFCRWRKYLMRNFPLRQKLFPYKTKNLTHKRWKRPANASSLSPRQHCTGCYSTELFTKVRKLPIPNLQHSHPLPWFSYQPLTMGQRR